LIFQIWGPWEVSDDPASCDVGPSCNEAVVWDVGCASADVRTHGGGDEDSCSICASQLKWNILLSKMFLTFKVDPK
jgi:hypothetical protein